MRIILNFYLKSIDIWGFKNYNENGSQDRGCQMIRKQSKQRDLVLNYMKQITGHVSAEEVFDGLNKDGKSVSLATVYRNLNILTQLHEIKKIAHPVNGYVYDKTCDPHYHLHCVECDELYDFPYPYMEHMNEDMQNQTGWTIHSHNTTFEGICPVCAKKGRS